MITVDEVIKHSRDREYMSGIERDISRIKATSEVFTPTPLVQHMLDTYIDPATIKDDFLDPSCGDGQILSEILIRKMQAGMSFEQALSTVYGVDLMQDNVDLCRERLLCGQEHLRHIVEKNIQCKNALTYGYNFEPMGPARRKTEEAARKRHARQESKRKENELKKLKEEKQAKIETRLFGKSLKLQTV